MLSEIFLTEYGQTLGLNVLKIYYMDYFPYYNATL